MQKSHGSDVDMRTAAFINAIDKIVVCYEELGIFPSLGQPRPHTKYDSGQRDAGLLDTRQSRHHVPAF